ncbi:NAD(P)-binding protein [Plenodomus tracheiphilus IPT5]|uniref:Short-chain dehydrogenase/reductase 3 n=1 Tax=Plenodomus tracheiphilus IPT5 TaxID=1408161 RepID=A0A6A7BGC0_9PLEO|nr:NAD(P)-binding protein [Plenodomus tracheiphilus IPT5]
MFRAVLLTVASIAVWIIKPQSYRLGGFSLTASQFTTLQWYLKWALPLWTVIDLNSALNRLAENRWSWKSDKSRWVWSKEVAVVTGGSAGIGACVVKRLVSQGVKVAVLDISPPKASFTSDERTYIRYYKCDITSRENIREAAKAIRSDLGSPSILINNAGIGNASTILDVPTENLRKLFDINLLSHWSTVKEFLPDMIAKKKGHIMSVASLASFVALAGAVDYACTKAALLAFHEGLTQELKHRYKCPEIKTTIVHPNWTKSAITAHPSVQAGLKSVGAKMLEPEDVASALVKQIVAAKSGQLVLGPALSPKVRALPLWLQELLRDSQANVVTGIGSSAGG